ncbi:MAG: SusF/SusE family outer membrane protein, partial [Dysgonamonadaceae bacterium]|nr:SusF/SusE family outer membrane protein [Dysgonamonadaceae bacterium]
PSGAITGRRAGSATITITSNGISKNIQVAVTEYVSQLITPMMLPIALNAEPRPVGVKFLPEGKTTQLSYSFVPEGIASIDDADRLIALSEGSAMLTISDMDNDAISATIPITVFPSGYVPLLLSGSVSAAPLLMNEQVAGKKYHWEGDLLTGSFKFLYHPSYDLPSLNKGTNDASLTERTDAAQPDQLFTVSQRGFYKIDVDRENMIISYTRNTPQYTFPDVYLIGDAVVEAGWDFKLAAQWDSSNPGLYIWNCTLKSGILHFRCGNNWPNETFRPLQSNQSIRETGVQFLNPDPSDTQWSVSSGDAGSYKVTLDVIDMKVYFEKQ